MVMEDRMPKGMKMVLEERGINIVRMNADNMRVVLFNHEDFRTEKILVENFLEARNHIVLFIPKFHCKLNPIGGYGGRQKYLHVHTQISLLATFGKSLVQRWTQLVQTKSENILEELMNMKRHLSMERRQEENKNRL